MGDDRAADGPPPPDGVRTTRRRGRTSPAKVAALRDLGPRWALPPQDPSGPLDLRRGFEGLAEVRLDIGVGDGAATRDWASRHPSSMVVAIELHRPGLAKLLGALEADGPENVRVVEADAVGVLDRLEAGSVTAIRVLFPDPWPKRRHVERRMVDRAFVSRAATVLVPGGELHLATDWADYAAHMRSMAATEPRFVHDDGSGRPERPVTGYEQRGVDAGRTITDLVYRRDV